MSSSCQIKPFLIFPTCGNAAEAKKFWHKLLTWLIAHPLSNNKTPAQSRTGVLHLAVAAGFEPAVGGYPTFAFEANTFGRSDTLPRIRIANIAAATQTTTQTSHTKPRRRPTTHKSERKSSKKFVMSSAHSVSRMPPRTCTVWRTAGSRTTSKAEPQAPVLGS